MLLPFKLFRKETQRHSCFKDYMNYVMCIDKLDKCNLRIAFLERCRDSNIIPKFLSFRIPQNGCFDNNSVEKFQRGLLLKEIAKARSTFTECTLRVEEKRDILKQKLPAKCVASAVVYSRIQRVSSRKLVAQKHDKKLKTLSLQQQKPLFNVKNTIRIVDVPINIPNYVIQTLALGPRNPVLTRFNEKDVLVELDCFLNFCSDHYIPECTMTDINVKTLSYIKSCKQQKTPRHVNLTRQFLSKNNLLAIPFDKGIGYCVMPKQTYEEKLNPILQLPQFEKYCDKRKNAKSPVFKEEERVMSALKDLKREGKISEQLFNEIKPVGSQIPRLYGLAKVHKNGTPLRPIVSMPGSAYQGIAKKIAAWLALVPECCINTSTQKMNNELRKNVGENDVLISFDVSSLYTNVPVNESIEYCAELLFKKIAIQSIDKDTFIKLAKLACCDVVFMSHDGVYVQKDGLAMGSPPAPHLANGWMSQFDPIIKDKSSLYERYMDDIVCNVRIDEVEDRLDLINNLHQNLSFTFELQKEGNLPFLDMLLHNDNGKLSSSWYRKTTDTGLTLNFHALAPLRYKKSVITSFVHRIYRACSSWELFDKSLNDAIAILEDNQYPSSFTMPIINSTLCKILSEDKDNVANEKEECEDVTVLDDNACLNVVSEKDKFRFFVNYRGKATEKLANDFKRLNAPCKIVMTTKKVKTVMPSLKSPVPKMHMSNVVYKLHCPRCNSSYVGQTSRHLLHRTREHLGSRGIMRAHLDMCGIRDINEEDDISILGHSNILCKLMTLEALFINQLKPSLNHKDEYRSRTLTLKLY